jgi:hypothetical protein
MHVARAHTMQDNVTPWRKTQAAIAPRLLATMPRTFLYGAYAH